MRTNLLMMAILALSLFGGMAMAASNTIGGNTIAYLTIVGLPAGANIPLQIQNPTGVYQTLNFPITNWTTTLAVSFNTLEVNTYHGAIPYQFMGAGTTLTYKATTYTINESAGTLFKGFIFNTITPTTLPFYAYFNQSQWNAVQANELIAIGVSPSSPIIIGLVGNTIANVPYGTAIQGNIVAAGTTKKYATYNSVSGAINFITSNVVKATPPLTINVNGQTITKAGVYPIPIAIINGHVGLSGKTYYWINGSMTSSLLAGNKQTYSFSIILSNGTVLIPPTNTLAAGISQPFSYKINEYVSANITLDAAGNANYTPLDPSGITLPSQVLSWANITITNPGTAAVGLHSTQPMNFDGGRFQSYEASNMMNVEFFNTSTGTVLTCWLEGNTLNEMQTVNLYTSNNLLYWCNYPQGIAGSVSVVNAVAVGFGATSTNFFGSTTGEAPQLTATYGHYDNGGSVFPIYQSFIGSSVPSGWTQQGSTFVINNGASYPSTATGSDRLYYNNAQTTNAFQAFDSYANYSADNNGWAITGYMTNSGPYFQLFGTRWGGVASVGMCQVGAGTSCVQTSPYSWNTRFVSSTQYYVSGNANVSMGYGAWNAMGLSSNPTYIGLSEQGGSGSGGSSGSSISDTWLRIRTILPKGNEPTTTFTGAYTLNTGPTLIINPTSLTYPGTATITAACSGGDTCKVDMPLGTHLATGTPNAIYTTPIYAAGSYTFYANDITSGLTTSGAFTVNKNSTAVSCTYGPNPVYNGNTITTIRAAGLINCTAASYLNQVSGSLVYNGITVGTGNYVSYNAVWNDQVNTANYIVATSANYVSNSLAFSLVDSVYQFISVSPAAGPFYETQNQNFVYTLNITKAASTANLIFDDNSIYVENVLENVVPGTQTFTMPYTFPLIPSNNLPFTYNALLQVKLSPSGVVVNAGVINTIIANTWFNYLPTANAVPGNIIEGSNETIGLKINQAMVIGTATVAANVMIGNQGKSFVVAGPYTYSANLYSFINSKYGITMPTNTLAVPVAANIPVQLTFNGNSVWRNTSATFTTWLPVYESCAIPNTANAFTYTWKVIPQQTLYTNNVLFQGVYNISKNTYVSQTFNGLDSGLSPLNGASTYTSCFYPAWANFSTFGTFSYSANTFGSSRYFLVNQFTSNTLQNVVLYLQNNTNATAYNIGVQNVETSQFLPALVQVFEYIPNTGTSILVNEFQTPNGGLWQTTLNYGNQYKFSAYNITTGQLLASTGYTQASSCGASPCQYIIPVGSFITPFIQSIINNIKYNCATGATANVETVSCNYQSLNGTSYSTQLKIQIANTILGASTCIVNYTGASGALTCTAPHINITQYTYLFQVYAQFHNQTTWYPLSSGVFGRQASLFGQTGMFLAAMIIICLALVFITKSPSITMFAVALGTIASYFLKLFNAPVLFLGCILLLIAVVIFVIERRQ